MIKNNKKYLTISEVAKKVGLTADHIRHRVYAGKVKAIKYSNLLWIEQKDIHKLKRQRQSFPKVK